MMLPDSFCIHCFSNQTVCSLKLLSLSYSFGGEGIFFIACKVLYIIDALLIFVDYYVNDRLHEVFKSTEDSLTEVFKTL